MSKKISDHGEVSLRSSTRIALRATTSKDPSQILKGMPEGGIDNYENRALKEEYHLQSIFPCEIWMIIMDMLGDSPNDLEAVANSSPYFRKLNLHNRTVFLFPKVWPILVDKQYHNQLCTETEPGMIYRTWHDSVLKLRQICRTWNEVIDHACRQEKALFAFEDDPLSTIFYENIYHDRASINHLSDHYSFQKFRIHFDATHSRSSRSPFISKYVDFNNNQRRLNEEIVGTLNDFLSRYGKHIWYFTINIQETEDFTVQQMSTFLIEWLTQLTNVKVLKIFITMRRTPTEAELEEALNNDTFPTLQSLEMLEIGVSPDFLSRLLLFRNDHVSKIAIPALHSPNKTPTLPASLPNLKSIHLCIASETDLEYLEQVEWKLEGLLLDLNIFSSAYNLATIFTLLERKWADTLTDVKLKFMCASGFQVNSHLSPEQKDKIIEECSMQRLNLPKLESLSVILNSYIPLDFILPMKNTLEYLDVRVGFCDRILPKLSSKLEKNQEIQFLGYFDRMLESNIWLLFPKLQRIYVTHPYEPEHDWECGDPLLCYTRHDWMKASKSTL